MRGAACPAPSVYKNGKHCAPVAFFARCRTPHTPHRAARGHSRPTEPEPYGSAARVRRRARGIYFSRAACPDARRWAAAAPAEAFIPACLTPAVRSPLCPLPGARALPRGGSAGPPGGCSFHAKPRAKRVAYTRAEGPCRGQASLCGAGMDFPCGPETGGFPPWRKPARFHKAAASSPLYPLPGARALPRGGSAGPPGGCSFHAKPRAKRVAYTRAEGPCRGQASLCGAGMDFPCGPETGGFPPWRKPARFHKAAASSPLCPLPGIKASPRGAPASPPGGFL